MALSGVFRMLITGRVHRLKSHLSCCRCLFTQNRLGIQILGLFIFAIGYFNPEYRTTLTRQPYLSSKNSLVNLFELKINAGDMLSQTRATPFSSVLTDVCCIF